MVMMMMMMMMMIYLIIMFKPVTENTSETVEFVCRSILHQGTAFGVNSVVILTTQHILCKCDICCHNFVGFIANLKGPYFQPSLSVCLCVCVCLWPALVPFNVDRFWWNLVTRTLLWSSLAVTIMVQIGCRGTMRRLFENFKKFSKIT